MISPFRIVILFILCLITGAFFLQNIYITNDFKSHSSNQIRVSFSSTRLSSNRIEKELTAPLEDILSQINNLKSINSTSHKGNGNITLFFSPGTDLNLKRIEIIMLLRKFPQLTSSTGFPIVEIIGQNQSNNVPILTYTLSGDTSIRELIRVGENRVYKKLLKIPGINHIQLPNNDFEALFIEYDLKKMILFDITYTDIKNSIALADNSNLIGQTRSKNGLIKNLIITDKITTDYDLLNTNIYHSGELTQHKLGDFSKIVREDEITNSNFRINAQNSVLISIFSQPNLNQLSLADKIATEISIIKSQLPPNLTLRLDEDKLQALRSGIQINFQRLSFSLLLLALLLFCFYRNIKHVLNILLSVLVNISISIFLIKILGIQISVFSIAGLAISFSIMIDYAIIMLDYFIEFKNKDVFPGILAGTLVTVSSIGLIFLMPDQYQGVLKDFSNILIIVLISSLVTNYWFTTGFYNLIQKPSRKHVPDKLRSNTKGVTFYSNILTVLLNRKYVLILFIAFSFGFPFFLLPKKWGDQNWYNKTIGSNFYQTELSPIVDKITGGTVRLFLNFVIGKNNFSDHSVTKLVVRARVRSGNSLEQMNMILKDIEIHLLKFGDNIKFTTNIYSGEEGEIVVGFDRNDEISGFPNKLKLELIRKTSKSGGVDWDIYGLGKAFTNSNESGVPQFVYKFKGYNYDEIVNQTASFTKTLQKHPRILNVNADFKFGLGSPTKEYSLLVDPALMTLANLNKAELLNAMKNISNPGEAISKLKLNGQDLTLKMRGKNSQIFQKYNLLHDNTNLSSSSKIRLGRISKIELKDATFSIDKENREYIKVIGFDYFGNELFGRATVDSLLNVFRSNLPIGYNISDELATQDSDIKLNSLLFLVLLLILNYIICCILFENFWYSFVTVMMVPISYIGVFLGSFLFDVEFDQGGIAAFIVLDALIVNACIFIINDLKIQLKNGMAFTLKLLAKVILNRFRTIILTFSTSIISSVIFLFDGNKETFWYSFSSTIILGLIFSVLPILFVFPVFLLKKSRYRNGYGRFNAFEKYKGLLSKFSR